MGKAHVLLLLIFLSGNIFSQTYIDSTFSNLFSTFNIKPTPNGITVDTTVLFNHARDKKVKVQHVGIPSFQNFDTTCIINGFTTPSQGSISFLPEQNGSYIIVDLGESTSINKIKIFHYFLAGYKLYGGNDSTAMQLFFQKDTVYSAYTTIEDTFAAINSRFIKLEIHRQIQQTAIVEIELYGNDKAKIASITSKPVGLSKQMNFNNIFLSGTGIDNGSLFYRFRAGDNPNINASWCAWSDYVPASAPLITCNEKSYFQFQVKLVKNNPVLPVLNKVVIGYSVSSQQFYQIYTNVDLGLSSQNFYVESVTTDNKKRPWLVLSHTIDGNHKYSALCFEGETVKYKLEEFGYPSHLLIKADNKGTVYYLSRDYSSKISKFADTSWVNLLLPVPYQYVSTMHVDASDNLWINGPGVYKFNGTVWTGYDSYTSGLPVNTVNEISSDQFGNIWFATEGGGLAKLSPNENWEVFNTSNSNLLNNYVQKVRVNNKGHVWLKCNGSFGSQTLMKFDGQTFTNMNSIGNVQYEYTFDLQGNLIFVNNDGLHFYNGESTTTLNEENSFLYNSGLSRITVDNEGTIWTGKHWGSGLGNNLYRYNKEGILSSANEEINLDEKLGFHLSYNYPNPFNPSTNINFFLPSSGKVQLKIYDILGRKVETLINKEMREGNHTINFNGSNLSSGVYFYNLNFNGMQQSGKMVLAK